jgi:hypothetical protein
VTDKDEVEKELEIQIARYTHAYLGSEGANLNFTDLMAKMPLYSMYANYLSTKRLERLNRILAYSTLTLAVTTALSIMLSLGLRP